MSFLYPSFLFALAAIAIPIIIHLFNFRKFRRVYFSNVRFLRSVQQETQSRNKLRHLLILFSRILAITCMVLAFAQPFIPGSSQEKNTTGEKVVSIYLDNSFSMDAQEKGGRMLDMGKKYAEEISDLLGAGDRVQLLTNDFEGKHQVFYTPGEFEGLLNEVTLSPASRPLSEVVKRQFDLLNNDKAPVKRAYVISDFQESITDVASLPSDSTIVVQMIPLRPNVAANVYIDSCWFASPELQVDQPATLRVRIVNASDQDLENIPLKFYLDNEQKTPASFSAAANSTIETELNFTIKKSGMLEGKLSLQDQQITFDDNYYISFRVLDHLNILNLKGEGAASYIDRLFGNDPYFRLTSIAAGQVDYSVFSQQQLIIVNEPSAISSGLSQELKKFLDAGGSVLVIPSATAEISTYNDFFSMAGVNTYSGRDTADSRIDDITATQSFYSDVFESIPKNMDLPAVLQSYSITANTRKNSETLLRMRNGKKFYSRDGSGKGYVYQLAVSLDERFSGFPRNALFVPTILKTAFGSQQVGDLSYTIGKDAYATIPATIVKGDLVYKIRNREQQLEVIPEQRTVNNSTFLYLNDRLRQDGIYEIVLGDSVYGKLALNYDRRESDPSAYTTEALQSLLREHAKDGYALLKADETSFKKVLAESEQGIRLWKLFIILALVFLAAEILLLRFMKG